MAKEKEARYTLSDEEFDLLVNGKSIILIPFPHNVNEPIIRVNLSDIGFDRMKELIEQAEENSALDSIKS